MLGKQYKLSAHVVYHLSNSSSLLHHKWSSGHFQFYRMTQTFKQNPGITRYFSMPHCTVSSSLTLCDIIFHVYSSLLQSWVTQRHQLLVLLWKRFSSLDPVTEGRGRGKFKLSQKNRINGYIWCFQDASPSVGDVGAVGETRSGFRDILSNSAWTSVKTAFWPT